MHASSCVSEGWHCIVVILLQCCHARAVCFAFKNFWLTLYVWSSTWHPFWFYLSVSHYCFGCCVLLFGWCQQPRRQVIKYHILIITEFIVVSTFCLMMQFTHSIASHFLWAQLAFLSCAWFKWSHSAGWSLWLSHCGLMIWQVLAVSHQSGSWHSNPVNLRLSIIFSS